jgi:hypothetical protein
MFSTLVLFTRTGRRLVARGTIVYYHYSALTLVPTSPALCAPTILKILFWDFFHPSPRGLGNKQQQKQV